MLDALTQRLSNVVKTLRGHSRITEENVQVLNHSDAGCSPECQSCIVQFSVQGRALPQ